MTEGIPRNALAGDLLPAGVAVTDQRLALVSVNQELAALLGRTPESLAGKPLDELFAPASRVMLHNYLLPLLQLHGRVEEFAATLNAAGSDRPEVLLYARWSALDDGSESGSRSLTSPQEASRRPERRLQIVVVRHRARRQLEDDLLRIQRAADQSPGVMFQLLEQPGTELVFPYASEALRALYRVSPDQARRDGHLVFRRIHPQDRRSLMARTAQDRSLGTCEIQMGLRIRQGPGEWRRHEVQATGRARSDGEWLWHGYASDVTERHELQRVIQQRNASEEARLQQLGFLSRLSHELRTPLNAMLGFSQVLLRHGDPPLPSAHREPVEMIGQAGRHLLRMLDDVLEVSRLQTGDFSMELEAVDVRVVVDDSLKLQQPLAEAAGVKLGFAPALEAMARADPNRLRQVLTSLIGNAIKFNLPGGSVGIELHRRDSEVAIVVVDDGPGLSESQQRQLFQPFNRLGAERSGVAGTGLGLVICRHLVEAMNGRIEVQSQPGQGARFTVCLPAVQAVAPELERSATEASRSTLDVRRLLTGAPRPKPATGDVLYVEDDRVNALLMAAVLGSRPGVQLRMAVSVEEALRLVAEKAPDLLLLDRHLPDGDGMELLLRLRSLPGMAKVQAVLVSAAAMPDDIERAREIGFDGYWSKPLDVAATLEDLDRRLGRH